MDFLPAVPLSFIPFHLGLGGIAVNESGTSFASVAFHSHCVYIYRVDGSGLCTADAVVVGTAGESGFADGQLNSPAFACFVRRNGVDTLLICDVGNDRVVEVTGSGVFVRAISVTKGSVPLGIAYCGIGDVIAVSLFNASTVELRQYESGALKPDVTIGTVRNGDAQLDNPRGVAFSPDGRYLLVADWGNHRVSKFTTASGGFVAHVVTLKAHGIKWPRDVLQCGDGRMFVTQEGCCASLVCVGEDGVTVKNIVFRGTSGDAVAPWSLSYSHTLSVLVVKACVGNVFLLRDAWNTSSRCAWLCAITG
jgi:hypothetical protein